MRKNLNRERIEGRVYQHSLAIKQVQNSQSANFGKNFISGELEVAVDEECLNIISVHFTYVTETTAKGAKNITYGVLKQIIDEDNTVVKVGKDAAIKVRIDTALALNDFYTNDGSLVSVKRNEGGFVSIIDKLSPEAERNTFEVDMIITKITHIDADEEKNIEERLDVRGAIFDFKNAILPIDFSVENAAGIKYFESLEISGSEPLYTKVWGKIVCKTIVNTVKEDSAFGEPAVRNYERKSKNWIITGMSANPYEFDDESTITAEELQKAMQDRQVYLAEVKKRAEDFKASKTVSTPASAPIKMTSVNPAKKGSFNF